MIKGENFCVITSRYENSKDQRVKMIQVLTYGNEGLQLKKAFDSEQVFTPIAWRKVPGAEGLKFWYDKEPIISNGNLKLIFNDNSTDISKKLGKLPRLELDLRKLTLIATDRTP
jgi:hypothetical protein